ncbi:MAG: S41 family peptidase [Candidatus Paceibacterota bacterium]|jgi:carboxyl-terminal processing protease
MKKKIGLKLILAFLFISVLFGVFLLGVYYGYEKRPEIEKVTELVNKEVEVVKQEQVDFAPFWKAWNIINDKYLMENGTSTEKVTSQEKVWGAISGLVASLNDPYTVFLPPEEKKRFEDDISGNFTGVGMEIGVKNNVLTVISPLPDSPASRAGIKAGDQIVKIDNKITTNMSSDEAVGLIRGERGKPVRFVLLRVENEKPIELTVVRDVITIPTLKTEKLDNGVFIIRLYNFSAPAPGLFKNALQEFADTKTDKLILDLRGNPGGYLDAAVNIASWFLPIGKPVVIEKNSSGESDKVYRSKGYDVFNENLKMVILIDQGSASASEILAGALSEHNKAILIGEKTFGKGSVQELVSLTDDSSIKITVAKWYTPNGHSISQSGLDPDIKVSLKEEDIAVGRDLQEETAIKYLLEN